MITPADLFKLVRTETGLSQKDFAKTLGLTRLETISAYERGAKKITLEKLIRLQAYYEKQGQDQQIMNIINNHVELEINKIKELI